MEFVEATFETNPGITNADLFVGVRQIDPSAGEISA